MRLQQKIAVVYNYLGSATQGGYLGSSADELAREFFASLGNQKQREDFDYFICSSNSQISSELRAESPVPIAGFFLYSGRGWDIGAYIYSAKKLQNYDLVVFMNSQARFSSSSALVKIESAWKDSPAGILGMSSSFEVSPHVRTSSFAIPPQLLLGYPKRVSSRYDACVFEHSPVSVSSWVQDQGLSARVVYDSGVFSLSDSRNPAGVFRSGDQGLLLVSDRHTRYFQEAPMSERDILEKRANNYPPTTFRFRSSVMAWLLRQPLNPVMTIYSFLTASLSRKCNRKT